MSRDRSWSERLMTMSMRGHQWRRGCGRSLRELTYLCGNGVESLDENELEQRLRGSETGTEDVIVEFKSKERHEAVDKDAPVHFARTGTREENNLRAFRYGRCPP